MNRAELEEQQKLERKELQGQIQRIKHSTPKGDKKRQKDCKLEISRLESELQEKHRREIQELEDPLPSDVSQCEAAIVNLSVDETTGSGDQSTTQSQPNKKSKAAKRREKKEREEKERNARIAEGLAESVNSSRNVELALINKKLYDKGLQLHDIPSDGDCLYKAISHQLSLRTGQEIVDVREIRRRTAHTMRTAPDDYLPYITSSSGDILDASMYEEYLNTIENTHEWGGHVELKAMSSMLGYPIQVIQADQPDLHIDNSADIRSSPPPLTVVYHKKLYELGEHYNSVTVIQADTS